MASNDKTTHKQKISNTGLKKIVHLSTESWIGSFVDDHLVRQRSPRIDPGWFHPSELSTPCDRRLAFSFLGLPKNESITPKLLRIFHNGEWMHRRWQSYFRAMGILDKREAKFEVSSPPIRGSADAIVHHPINNDRSIIELKSINSNGFGRLVGPHEGHFNQVNIYMGALEVHQGFVIYENKDTQDFRVFPVRHDSVKWEQLQFRLLKIVRKINKDELPPIYEHEGCKSCPFFSFCYSAGDTVSKLSERVN